jgi:Na+-translocating ferredoxin:NAD+ oxidoreductase RNF subunit RnfB
MENKGRIWQIYQALPKLDCGRCRYESCGKYARALAEGRAPADLCVAGGAPVAFKIRIIMEAGALPREMREEEIKTLKDRVRRIQLEIRRIKSEIHKPSTPT